jgi:predicted MPP superfamily phosphohydrolase
VIKVGVHDLIDTAILAIVIVAQYRIGASILAASQKRSTRVQTLVRALLGAVWLWLALGFALNYQSANHLLRMPTWLRGALSGSAYLWAFSVTGGYIFFQCWRWLVYGAGEDTINPERRRLVNAAGCALVAAPFGLAGFGVLVQRTEFQTQEVEVPIPNLPRDLVGLRILQLTDIHLGPFLDERELARVIDESRNLHPHLAVITGDLISMRGDPLDTCLRQISRLNPEAGILGCLGNHEGYAGVEQYTEKQGARLGIDILRKRARPLRFGGATLNIAGVDYQPMAKRSDYLAGAERLIVPGAVNLLLSHNPDVFPAAAGKGFDLTIAGHTHGGQVNVEILHQDLNIARFLTPYVSGRYHLKRPSGDLASLYVSRGIGTIGLPLRLGAPPEITLLRLVGC